MDLKKASLFLFLLLCLHLQLQHHFAHAVSRSSTSLAFVDPNHDDLPFQEVELKPDGDVIEANLPKLTVVVKKGGGGGGRGGGGFGGGGRSFGGGGSSSRGGGGSSSRGGGGSSSRGGGLRPIPIYGGGTHRSGHHSSGGRETASGWLGLSILAGLGLVF
ncbi:hypothetical protein [Arabidopsis thaliana]|uniref:At3g04640 n=1 Tax=Arabidopsis thaliana TaxID=3702 RepID=Q9SR10_ARATH|nr:glycine-rich protein [Arabidopsis thaliana]NP_566234.1 glycine-rich protein [Arabidopsis thaliana]AAF04894.1 hypothetical protein [Arabidopsis thaliana]ABF58932.1 At3g04640 [Arabidopsis thaliana]AEE74111.1 glycine-rich protein [Arabidopsis thaliana]AEE74112.1 glycine-rich protein [Arabidopsis thaliana]|eukprot:NP_001078105.1 glycine-rich protein [Arabidopsis thaliana]